MNRGTIADVFLKNVEKYGDRTSLRQKKLGIWNDISWNQYYENATRVALGLYELGYRKGDRVAIIGENCPEWVYIDLGVICTGGAAVGIYTTNSWDQCEYVVEHSDSKFYFMENEEQLDKWLRFREKTPSLKKVIVWDLKGLRDFKDPQLISFRELLEIGEKKRQEEPELMKKLMSEVTPEDEALYIYTSGTTGRPKGAILTHENAVWIGKTMSEVNEIYETDSVLSFLPLCHIFEHMMTVFVHITCGYTVNFIENHDTISDNFREVSPSIGYAVPRVWEKYHSLITINMSDATIFKRLIYKAAMAAGSRHYRETRSKGKASFLTSLLFGLAHLAVFRKLRERLGFERMRAAYSGAAPISPGVLQFFNSIGLMLLEGYGQTEGTGVTTVNRLESPTEGTVGPPIDGVELKISDEGEILVKSPGVFKGYHKDPETTAMTLREGWLYSGDMGQLDSEGNLKITGRIKDIIITAGGKNITPQYIEGKLVFSPYINDAVVIGDQRKFLSALIVLDEDNTMKYAQDNKIQFSTYQDLAQNPEIVKLIHGEVENANRDLSRVEQIKKFRILPNKLYEEEGDVTPTMKVKRMFINKKFNDIIEEMYG
jgi:long-chain acyl-CoA synthetase